MRGCESSCHPHGPESGFTLLELVVTVAVILILAAIALPSFSGQSRRAKASSEVQPMFNDLRVRLEQYLQEHGHYPDTIGEDTMHPTAPPGATKQPLDPLPPKWDEIKVRISGDHEVYCRYTWATGRAGSTGGIGPTVIVRPPPPPPPDPPPDPPPNSFFFDVPGSDWYYLLAKCDMDGDPGTGKGPADKFSYYFTSSVNSTIQKVNEGR
jgi:prepilin-type N-terminal cleavage/methylation domain-containing protein